MANSSDRKTVLAVVLIFFGTILLLNKLHFFFIPWYVFTWQFLLIGIGFLLIVTQDKWEGGIILMTIGTAFLIPRVFDVTFRELFTYWPVLLIVLGVVILVRHIDGGGKKHLNNPNDTTENHF